MSHSSQRLTLPFWGAALVLVVALGVIFVFPFSPPQTVRINQVTVDDPNTVPAGEDGETIGEAMADQGISNMKQGGTSAKGTFDAELGTYKTTVSKNTSFTLITNSAFGLSLDKGKLNKVTVNGGITDGKGISDPNLAPATIGQLKWNVIVKDPAGKTIASGTTNSAVWTNATKPADSIVIQLPPTTKTTSVQPIGSITVSLSKPSAPVLVNITQVTYSTNSIQYIGPAEGGL